MTQETGGIFQGPLPVSPRPGLTHLSGGGSSQPPLGPGG